MPTTLRLILLERLPEFMKYEKLPPHNIVFDIPDKMLDKVNTP